MIVSSSLVSAKRPEDKSQPDDDLTIQHLTTIQTLAAKVKLS